MTDPLDTLARSTADRPFFLGSALDRYAAAYGLDDGDLTLALGCPVETLSMLRLCRMPAADEEGFRRDVETIAAGFGLDAGVLAGIVRAAGR